MTQHDDSVRIQHMLDHSREAVELAKREKRVKSGMPRFRGRKSSGCATDWHTAMRPLI